MLKIGICTGTQYDVDQEQVLLEYFMKGLQPPLKRSVSALKPNTIEDALGKATQFEMEGSQHDEFDNIAARSKKKKLI